MRILIIAGVLRRLHVGSLRAGSIALSEPESHHARDVLRLKSGDEVELFDDHGNTARAIIERCDALRLRVVVEAVAPAKDSSGITIAAAIPKGQRADWMIEKLSELGVDRFIPLQTARSAVIPSGRSKFERWNRIAIEAARQSRRSGMMRIDPLSQLELLLNPSPGTPAEDRGGGLRIFLSTEPDVAPLGQFISNLKSEILLLIGPEGGWTDDELRRMREAGLTGARLTRTILRTETAAVVAASIVATRL